MGYAGHGAGRPWAGVKLWQICKKCGHPHWRGKNTWKPCIKCGWHLFEEKRSKQHEEMVNSIKVGQ